MKNHRKENEKMKNIFKKLAAAAAAFAASAVMAFGASAEDYEFDLSDAAASNGQWGQTFIYYTGLDVGSPNDFDPHVITPDTEFIAEFDFEGEENSCPIELIFQAWEGGEGGAEKNIWAKVAPYDYDIGVAKFSYDDIISKFGTDNMDIVYAINVGDTGLGPVTLTKFTATNVNLGDAAPAETEAEEEEPDTEETEAEENEEETDEEPAEEETEAEVTEETTEATTTEAVTEAETTAATTAAPAESTTAATTIDYAANAPSENGAMPIIIGIIAVVVVGAIAAVVVMLVKKNSGKFY